MKISDDTEKFVNQHMDQITTSIILLLGYGIVVAALIIGSIQLLERGRIEVNKETIVYGRILAVLAVLMSMIAIKTLNKIMEHLPKMFQFSFNGVWI